MNIAEKVIQANKYNAEASSDRRQKKRHKATYRPCCIVTSGRVALGLMRNYSDGGALVEVDLAVQVGETLQYFWDEKSFIYAEVVWRKGNNIGLKHITSRASFSDAHPKRSVRVPCHAEASVWIDGARYPATVTNISIGGIRLNGLPDFDPGILASISFCGSEFSAATVRWSRDGTVGIRFAKRLTRENLAALLLSDEFGVSVIEFEGEQGRGAV